MPTSPHTQPVLVVWVLLLVPGCDHGINISKLKPDSLIRPICVKGPDMGNPGCPRPDVQVCRGEAEDWTVVLPAQARFEKIDVIADSSARGAATVDWEDSAGNLAGFLLTLPAGGTDAAKLAAGLVSQIKGSGAFKDVTVVDPGQPTTTHDGFPAVAGTSLTLTPASSTELHKIRDRLFPALTGLDIAQFSGLPQGPVETSNQFRLLFSTVARADGRAVVTGGVATLDSFANVLGRARIHAEDMASTTLLGRASARTTARCETFHFAAPGALDMLWVVNGSDSEAMGNARVRLHGAAGALWDRARSFGIDLRVAVVDMNQVKEVRFCTPKPSAECPNPGSGHFFGAGDTDLACFQACLLRPSGTKVPVPADYGLDSAKNTLLSLLARVDDDPHKLRKSAQVALVFAADVEDGHVAELFGGDVPIPPGPPDLKKVESVVQPLVGLLSTSPGSELAGTEVFALVTDPALDASCGTRRGTGYIELLSQLGRAHDVLCKAQDAMDALLESQIDDLAPLASLLRLGHTASAATLSATLNGSMIYRSLHNGFDYAPAQGALVLHGLTDSLGKTGNRIELSYVGW